MRQNSEQPDQAAHALPSHSIGSDFTIQSLAKLILSNVEIVLRLQPHPEPLYLSGHPSQHRWANQCRAESLTLPPESASLVK